MKRKNLVEGSPSGNARTSEQVSELRVGVPAVLGCLGRVLQVLQKLQREFSCCYWSYWHYWGVEAVLLGPQTAGSPQGRAIPSPSLQGAPGRAEIQLTEASPASHSRVQGGGLDLGGTCWVMDLGMEVLPEPWRKSEVSL